MKQVESLIFCLLAWVYRCSLYQSKTLVCGFSCIDSSGPFFLGVSAHLKTLLPTLILVLSSAPLSLRTAF